MNWETIISAGMKYPDLSHFVVIGCEAVTKKLFHTALLEVMVG